MEPVGFKKVVGLTPKGVQGICKYVTGIRNGSFYTSENLQDASIYTPGGAAECERKIEKFKAKTICKDWVTFVADVKVSL